MDDATSKQQVVERINQASNILVTVSANPSVDSLSAALSLTLMLNKLTKRATAVFSGKIPPAITFLNPGKTFATNVDGLRDFVIALDKNKADHLRYKVEDDVVRIFITPYRATITEKDLQFSQGDFNVDLIIALGVERRSDLDRAITAHGRILHDATVMTINAQTQKSSLGSVDWVGATASSLSEMIVGLSDALQPGLLDQQISTALLTGIVSATERFSNQRTSPQVMTIAAQLMAAGANQQLIATKLGPNGGGASGGGFNQNRPGPTNSSFEAIKNAPTDISLDIPKDETNSRAADAMSKSAPADDSTEGNDSRLNPNGFDAPESAPIEPRAPEPLPTVPSQDEPEPTDTVGANAVGEMSIDHNPNQQRSKKSRQRRPNKTAYGPPRPEAALAAAEEALAEALPIAPPAAQQAQDLQQAIAEDTAAMNAQDSSEPTASTFDTKVDVDTAPDTSMADEAGNDYSVDEKPPVAIEPPTAPIPLPDLPTQPNATPEAEAPAVEPTVDISIPPAPELPPELQNTSMTPPQEQPSAPAVTPEPAIILDKPGVAGAEPIDSNTTGPSSWKGRALERPIEPPTFGGTLNATTEQALEDNQRQTEEDRNQTILSHNASLDSTPPPQQTPPEPLLDALVKEEPPTPPPAPPTTLPELPEPPKPMPQAEASAPSPISQPEPASMPPAPAEPKIASTLEELEQAIGGRQSTEQPAAPTTEPVVDEDAARRAVHEALGSLPEVAPGQSQLSVTPTDFEAMPVPEPQSPPAETLDLSPQPSAEQSIAPLPAAPPLNTAPIAPVGDMSQPPIPDLTQLGTMPAPAAPGALPPLPDFSTLPQPPVGASTPEIPPISDMPAAPPELLPPEPAAPNTTVPTPAPAPNPSQFRIPGGQ